MNGVTAEVRPLSLTGQQALLWIAVGPICVPVEVTVRYDVVAFEAPDWVPDTVLESAHRIVFGEPV